MTEKIDLNQADATKLAALPGIGKGLAARIIDYRETVHPFTEVIELAAVPGISERMVRQIEEQLTVGAAAEAVAEDVPVEMPEPDSPELPVEMPEPDIEAFPEELPEELVDESPPVPSGAQSDEAILSVPLGTAAPPDRPGSPPLAAPAPPTAVRSSFPEHLVTAVAGAVLGMVLTLAVLLLLNGSLRLNEAGQVRLIEQQAVEAAATTQAEQSGIRDEIATFGTQFTAVATRESETAVLLETMQASLETAESKLAETEARLAALETVTAGLDERITAVADSAAKFDTFMDGLRDLLWTLQGAPLTPTATVTISATTTVTPTLTTTVTITPTAAATATQTPLATRTPRATATPLGEATPTPGN